MDKLLYDALEDIREFIVYNDIEITSKDDLIEMFVKMSSKGYFYRVKKENQMRKLRIVLKQFAKAYEQDKDILDTDLIIKGPRVVLEKLENFKKKTSVK